MPLIGNKDRIGFELIPVAPSWETKYAPESAAWAGTALWVGGRNLCAHIPQGASAVEDYLYVPLAPIADWVARSLTAIQFEERAPIFPTTRDLFGSVDRWADSRPGLGLTDDQWFEAREDWWNRHFLASGSDGAWSPNAAFVRDDEEMVIAWSKPRFVAPGAPTMLWPSGSASVPWDEGFSTLIDFVSVVAGWLEDAGLRDLYGWIGGTRETRARAPLRTALELYVGRSIEEILPMFGAGDYGGLLEALGLRIQDQDPAASAQCQALRDLSPMAPPIVGQVLQQSFARAAESNNDDRLADLRLLAVDGARAARDEIEAGQLAAVAIRRAIGLDGQPLGETVELLADCGISVLDAAVAGGPERMIVVGASSGGAAVTTLETPRTTRRWGRRFEHARALGHALLDPRRFGAFGAASGPFAQETRRRRSGAFAAELLLPASSMAEINEGHLDGAAEGTRFETFLEQYGVGARTAAWQLWNRGWLSSAEARDELVDRFAEPLE